VDGATEFDGACDFEQQDTPGECDRLYPGVVSSSGQRQYLARQHSLHLNWQLRALL